MNNLPIETYESVVQQPDATITNEGEITKIIKAAEKLVRCKGRYHSEQNYRTLAALFGVTVPDLPALPSDEAPAQPVSEPYKLEIDMDDADQFSITLLHEIIYGKELIWPEAKLLARFMLDVKQRASASPAQDDKSASTELPNHSNLSTNSPVIPDGWKLVPIEPTPKMLVAAMGMFTAEELAEAWGDMLAAAPAQESE